MSKDYHAVVWVDHSEAKVFRCSTDDDAEVDVHSHTSLKRLHRPHAATRVFAVESLGHPDAEALLALGRRYFPAAPRLTPENQSHAGEKSPAPKSH